MDRVKRFIITLEHLVSSKKKRHIVGGILLSTSIFLGGLALTVMSTKIEENVEEDEEDYDY
jgi:hypothetical protein